MSLNAATRVAPKEAVFRPALSLRPFAGSSPEKTMATLTYGQQLLHPNWQRLRLEVLSARGWECENCGDTEKTLHVHHKRYFKGRMAWEYELDDLTVLCESCHSTEHGARRLLDEIIAEAGPGQMDLIIGLAVGYLDASCSLEPSLALRAKEGRELMYELGLAAAALEYGRDGAAVRETVRRVVRDYPYVTPTLHIAVQKWNDENG